MLARNAIEYWKHTVVGDIVVGRSNHLGLRHTVTALVNYDTSPLAGEIVNSLVDHPHIVICCTWGDIPLESCPWTSFRHQSLPLMDVDGPKNLLVISGHDEA